VHETIIRILQNMHNILKYAEKHGYAEYAKKNAEQA
jgi:hypothetical protein